MKHTDIIKLIENTAPISLAAPWDKSGIQVAAYQENISHLAIILDPVPAQIEKAIALGADFILAHHPLSMEPRFTDQLDAYHKILSLLFRNNIWLYSAHTSLDSNPCGPVNWLAVKLGLHNKTVLEPSGTFEIYGKSTSVGFGCYGELTEAEPYEVFCKKLSVAIGSHEWRVCGEKPATVKRVAFCPGSGGSLMTEAKKLGADVYITGDIRFHSALEADLRVIDVGHFILEEIMMQQFAELLRKEAPGLQISFIPGIDPLTFEKY